MKKSKLLNNKNLSIILFFLLLGLGTQAEEVVDIWKIENNKTAQDTSVIENTDEVIQENKIYEMQSKKKESSNLVEDQTLKSNEVTIVGLYDPEQNGLSIDMWSNSDGDQILQIIKNINKIKLSQDATELLNIALLTNSYYPNKNITKKKFLEIKTDWLIKNSDLELIEDYLLNNQTSNENQDLIKFLVDDYLSNSQIKKSCDVFQKINKKIEDNYLSKFQIYCLINSNKKEEAQLLLDLKKELGFKDKFFEKKISFLMGYTNESDKMISENSILDFHISHKTNPDFKYEPNNSTSKKIWRYLSTSNLLDNIQNVEVSDIEKIKIIEQATHERNYSEKELFQLYKRFQFNINQLLNIKEASKVLATVESRALIYQGILITEEPAKKIELIYSLKQSFKKDSLANAFNQELRSLLNRINIGDVPSNYTTFYQTHLEEGVIDVKNIKINNKILHQSKLINYFKEENTIKNITKELNDSLKKIKKNKKYFFSKKDIILVEALKSDDVQILDKYKNLYEISDSEIPSDIQIFINNNDMGAALLRIVEVIGQDKLKDIDDDTMFFVISTLNQLDLDPLRNKILLKFLPLKV
jgi:hypothetical protein